MRFLIVIKMGYLIKQEKFEIIWEFLKNKRLYMEARVGYGSFDENAAQYI